MTKSVALGHDVLQVRENRAQGDLLNAIDSPNIAANLPDFHRLSSRGDTGFSFAERRRKTGRSVSRIDSGTRINALTGLFSQSIL